MSCICVVPDSKSSYTLVGCISLFLSCFGQVGTLLAHQKRKHIRLSDGEVARPALIREEVREHFLYAIQRHVPEILRSLEHDVLPLYLPLYVATAPAMRPWYGWTEGRKLVSPGTPVTDIPDHEIEVITPEAVKARQAVISWAEDYHLGPSNFEREGLPGDTWFLERAHDTLRYWCHRRYSDTRGKAWSPLGASDMLRFELSQRNAERKAEVFDPGKVRPLRFSSAPTIAIHFPSYEWQPDGELEADLEDRIIANVRHWLRQHIAYGKAVAQQHRWEPTLEKRELENHLKWVVLYQVKELNFTEVAKCVHRNRRHVTNEISNTAELIGIILRPARRGRPKKQDSVA